MTGEPPARAWLGRIDPVETVESVELAEPAG